MVIVILAVLAAIALPKFADRDVFAARGFFDETLAAVRYAHKLAIASGCDVQVELTAGAYGLLARSGCTSGTFTASVEHPTRTGGFAASAPQGVVISPPVTLYFDKIGRPRDTSGSLLGATTGISVGATTLNIEPETGYSYEP